MSTHDPTEEKYHATVASLADRISTRLGSLEDNDRVLEYLASKSEIHVVDSETGEKQKTIALDADETPADFRAWVAEHEDELPTIDWNEEVF